MKTHGTLLISGVMAVTALLAAPSHAVDKNGKFATARLWPVSKDAMKVEGYVLGGEVKDFVLRADGAGPMKANDCFKSAPEQQNRPLRFGHLNLAAPPEGYNQILAWLAITNDGVAEGLVEVRALEIWTKGPGGEVTLVSDDLFNKDTSEPGRLVWGSMLLDKEQWDDANAWALRCDDRVPPVCENPVVFELSWIESKTGLFRIPTAVFRTSTLPNQVFHPWTAAWDDADDVSPMPDAFPDHQYAVKIVARVSGAARLQAGFDFYKVGRGGENVEAAMSNWQCAAPGWVTVIVGAPGILQP